MENFLSVIIRFFHFIFMYTPLIVRVFYVFVSCIEVVTGGVLTEKLFSKISQNSQENHYTRASFLIKL